MTGNADLRGLQFELSNDCVVHLDAEGRIVEASHEFYQVAGSPVEICGQNFFEIVWIDAGLAELRSQFAELVSGGRGRFGNRAMAMAVDDKRFIAYLTGVAVYGGSGKVQKVVVMLVPERTVPGEAFIAHGKKILTEMDCRILECVAAGVPTARLAALVDLSHGGVEYHVTSLLRKLKVTNRTSLVSKAYAYGILAFGVWPPKVVSDFVK